MFLNGTGMGEVIIQVDVERLRHGGGSSVLNPVIIRKGIIMDTTTNEILSCMDTSSGSSVDASCVYEDITNYRNTSFIDNNAYKDCPDDVGSFVIPEDTVAFTVLDSIAIYPGVTKAGGKTLPKKGTLTKKIIGYAGYDYCNQHDNCYWKYGCHTAYSYAGIVIQRTYFKYGGRGDKPQFPSGPAYPSMTYDSIPPKCGRVNSPAVTIHDNLGVKLFRDKQ